MGRFLAWSMRWLATDQRVGIVLLKFMAVLTVALGSMVGLIALGTWIVGDAWGGVALVVIVMTQPLWWRRFSRSRSPLPRAQTRPSRPAAPN